MRNLLALLAAFTLSTSTAITAVACGTTEQTTVRIFDWNGVVNGQNGKTADDFFQLLLNNQDAGIGQALYKDIVDYISLSILKTNPTFTTDYQFATQSIENQIKNIQDSLRAKYGRSWETQWKNFLKDPAQGGDGQSGSYQRYFDILLKSQANTIVSQYYVGDNYHNFQYYSSTEIGIWLNDIFKQFKNGTSLKNYISTEIYGNKVWIVAKAHDASDTDADENDPFPKLRQALENATTVNDISLSNIVPKTKDDQPSTTGDNYLIDPSNTIKGLLSNQQAKIAQVWMKNQGPIWARQIVVPFNAGDAKNNALKREIRQDDFDATTLQRIIGNIQNHDFEYALKYEMNDSISKSSNSAASGDLGLITLNSDTANIKASFSYYLYRYVTSNQGIGQNSSTTEPYNLTQFTGNDFGSLFPLVNRTYTNSPNQSSPYNDLVWMTDPTATTNNPKYSGVDEDKVSIFIDEDGLHFVQTPGISYSSTISTDSTEKIITDYTQKISNKNQTITWADVQKVADRPGGLTNNPYLDYLQTQYLLWNANNETLYFDLNDSLSKFTSGSTDIASDVWWDYILYFNNNVDNIHWNLLTNEEALTSVLNTKINASQDKIYDFVRSMQGWFNTTFNRRWSSQQGISSTTTLVKNITTLNKKWEEDIDYITGPAARLNAKDIENYLTNVAAQTIWWYDPNNIKN